MASDVVLEVKGMTTSFKTDDGLVQAVRGLDFEVRPGEVLAVVGESGSGKSVTAMTLMGLLPKSAIVSGEANFKGRNLLAMSDRELRKVRGKSIAMIFQDPMTALNPVHTVGAQLAEAVLVHNNVSKAAAWSRAAELLESVGIPEAKQRVKAYPHEFSGGMRQRAMIAMAMANEPELLIADEPTTALDVTIQAQVIDLMKVVQEQTGSAMMLITHDLGLVAGTADRVQVMYAGQIVESGPTNEVFYDPLNPYTLGLMASIPRLDERSAERLNPIPGAPPSLINLPAGCPFRPRCDFADDRCLAEVPDLRSLTATHATRCHHAESLVELKVKSS